MIKNISNLGDAALYCDFGNAVNKEINSNVIKYFKSLQKNKIPGITNITPSYNKLIISFDLENIKYEQLKSEILKIEISKLEAQEKKNVQIPVCTDDEFCLDMSNFASYWDSDENPYHEDDFVSFLPFKITNITTDRQVRVFHDDAGIYNHGNPPSQDLIGITQADVPGYSDCIWQPNEIISFAYDMIAYSSDLTDIEDQKTYNLSLEYDFSAVREKYGQELVVDDDGFPYYDLFDFWNVELADDESIVIVEKDYSKGDIVEVLKIVSFGGELVSTGVSGIFKASREIINSEEVYPNICGGICPPNAVYDNDGDGLNDSPWEQLYPWDDGDYVIISPDKWYNDGDYWTVDLSRIGQKEDLTSTLMDSIIVVPNPYVVNSLYNEEIYGNRLLFDKLPKQCTISIYTVTGEFVNTISHGGSSNLSGSEPWDLKNENGDLVHPGLYFYVVQASGVPDKMGKFVIIR